MVQEYIDLQSDCYRRKRKRHAEKIMESTLFFPTRVETRYAARAVPYKGGRAIMRNARRDVSALKGQQP